MELVTDDPKFKELMKEIRQAQYSSNIERWRAENEFLSKKLKAGLLSMAEYLRYYNYY